ncbi:MAG: hypothetical protein A2X36_04045 [Elusimicrobia bacterium GWA2_69_24]|nr:MAG: hypothetical protein A2X36_04045 [Elusimicrobia bacterium GWA2_69_24]HBL16050.1 hypothetical protein [Elusimicrobiota bacterium]
MRRSSLPRALALLAGAAVLPASALAAPSTATLRGALQSMGMHCPGACGPAVERSQLRGDWEGKERSYWTVLASTGPVKVRLDAVRNLDRKEAELWRRERLSVVRGLFQGTAEYPGIITQGFEVAEDLRPVSVPGSPRGSEVLILYATPRLTYGAGAADLVAYRALLSFRYCPKERVSVQVELFFPKDSFPRDEALALLQGYDCR